MAFEILDVPAFIQKVKAKAVTTARSFNQNMEATDNGLQSKSIFGISSKDKFELWGYINLEDVVMHPLIYDNISHINVDFNRIIQKKKKYKIADGLLVENQSGGNGVGWLISNWDKINFDKYRTEKNKLFVDFIKNTKMNLIFINKVPVIPIAYREARMTGFRPEENEVDALYKKILAFSKTDRTDFTSSFMETIKDKTNKDFIQDAVNGLYKYFIKQLESKRGFVRGAMTSKRLDNVSRMVANANPDIPINSCVIPWQILLNMFDIFVVAYLKNDETEGLAEKLGLNDKRLEEYGDLFDYIYRNTNTYTKHYPGHREIWIDILTGIFNENPMMRVLVKRDPGWNANSLHCFKPLIGTENMYHILVPSWVYDPLGGDSFNTNFMIDELSNNIIFEDDKYKITGDLPRARVVKTMDSIWKKLEEKGS
jgi:DNA-directed RNA polymerase beta' subunit